MKIEKLPQKYYPFCPLLGIYEVAVISGMVAAFLITLILLGVI